jgi:hypothetical protein
MDVYVDESGDLGFKPNSTKFFVVAFISCPTPYNLRKDMSHLLKRFHVRGGYSYVHNELKFSKMSSYCRTCVLEKIASSNSYIGVIVVQKNKISDRLRNDPTILYNYLVVQNVVSALFPMIVANQRFHLVMDKSKSRRKMEDFDNYVKAKIGFVSYTNGKTIAQNNITSAHLDSITEPCLQAVDCVAGAYLQAYENGNQEYEKILNGKLSYFNYLWR